MNVLWLLAGLAASESTPPTPYPGQVFCKTEEACPKPCWHTTAQTCEDKGSEIKCYNFYDVCCGNKGDACEPHVEAPAERVALEAAPKSIGAWIKSHLLAGHELVHPIFMLRHDARALQAFDQIIADVSDPDSPKYGQYLSHAQVKEALPVADGVHAAVANFLREHGVTEFETSLHGDMVKASVPAAAAAKMFGATFARFAHPEASVELVRAESGYTMPKELELAVYMVGNLNEFPDVKRTDLITEGPTADAGSFGSDCDSCAGKVTPQVLAQRYELDTAAPAVPLLSAGSNMTGGMATAEFQGVMWTPAALKKFSDNCHLKSPAVVDKQVGTNTPSKCHIPGVGTMLCTEALLDIEYAKAIIGSEQLTNIFSQQFSLLDWASSVDNLGDEGPAVHSVSYGNDEAQQTSPAFIQSANVQFMKCAARGVSILFASGDQGVCGREGCGGAFHPDFPAGSPYITSVGGTDFAAAGVIGDEKTWSGGGGGFSNNFGIPKWQQDAVRNYLSEAKKAGNLPAANLFNATGRGYPDVSALAGQQNPYCIASQGVLSASMTGVAGTSAACPVFAGVITKLNAARIAKNMPRLGYLNPWLYKNPDMFHDVKLGTNDAGGPAGFTAMAGWDPATGLGTPRYSKMLQAALRRGTPHTEEIVV